MVLTRTQMEQYTKDQPIDQLMNASDVMAKLDDLTKRFDNFMVKYNEVSSELSIVKNCNSLLLQRIINLERNVLNASQYHRREIIEINPVPEDIQDNVLEATVCRALSLTGHNVIPADLQACHRMRRKSHVVVKFKNRKLKHNVFTSRKKLLEKGSDLTNLKFSGKLFIAESMCNENHQLAYICRKLKKSAKIHSSWFINNALNVKLSQNGDIHKIFHITDLEELIGIDNVAEFI